MRGKIATVNAGSSSVKTALFAAPITGLDDRPLFECSVSAIGERPVARFRDVRAGRVEERSIEPGSGYAGAFDLLFDRLAHEVSGAELLAVGHRIVHGGSRFAAPVVVGTAEMNALRELEPLAPRHQPFNLAGVECAARFWPEALQVGCFDTAFHRTQPRLNQLYALPAEFADAGIMRYGFHGLSFEYVLTRAKAQLGAQLGERVVIAHLGAGASLCAIRGGRSVATTMGFSTLDGLPMATRSGAIDPGVVLHLMREDGMDAAALEHLLYNRAGLLGLSGKSGEIRELCASGDPAAQTAIAYFIEHCVRQIAAMAAAIGGIDALIFTAGIGENAAQVRHGIVGSLGWLGFEIDAARNAANGPSITAAGSPAKAWVIPTNEELMIARHVDRLLAARREGV